MNAQQYPVLLLDSAYSPMKTIGWQRAITLLSLGKIEILESYDGFVRSQLVVIKIPAVARLLNVFKKHKKPVKFSRLNVFARDRFCCSYCGGKFNINDLTYDHVVPRDHGGRTEWTNIVSCCNPCNSKKRNRTPEQAGMRLKSKPVQPKWSPVVAFNINGDCPQAWRDYIYWNVELSED